MVTHPVINPVRHGLTWVNKRELVSPLVQAETEVSLPGGEISHWALMFNFQN